MKYYWYVINNTYIDMKITSNKNVLIYINGGYKILYAADRKQKCINFIKWTTKYHNETLKQHGISN